MEYASDGTSLGHEESGLLARMSHELRTPLNAIIGFAQLLEMGELTEAQRRSVHQIARAGRTLLQLVDEALDVSRLESGELGISVEPVDAAATIRTALDLVRPLAEERGIELATPDGVPRTVLADAQRLKQVILNLVSNAVKYNREAGRVEIATSAPEDGRVRISVKDTGPGISPEVVTRLYDPFERLGAERRGIDGTGLGLTLAKGLTEAMGGRIGVESEVGVGSTFWIEFDAAEDRDPATEGRGRDVTLRARSSAAGRTVLYIEDNLMNIELISELLASRNEIGLMTAIQGRLGIELAQLHAPDLIFLDLNLPDVGGDAVLLELKADARTRDIPVVILSSDALATQTERLRGAGATAYLTKPLDLHSFLELLDELLA